MIIPRIRQTIWPAVILLRRLLVWGRCRRLKECVAIEDHRTRPDVTASQRYWTGHTVASVPFNSAKESFAHLEERGGYYPQFEEFMALYGDHEGEVVVDYGCGPGNDLVGFLTRSRAKTIIGIDVSKTALQLASHRLGWHDDKDLSRVRLILKSEVDPKIPLEAASVDHIYCEGVLHHTTHPVAIMKEFYRILKPGSSAMVMIYNEQSVWVQLYVAYYRMILQGIDSKLPLREAFERSADGEGCPIALCWKPHEFAGMAEQAGFRVEYRGGYLGSSELEQIETHYDAAIRDPRLPREQRNFLSSLEFDERGYPFCGGKHVGLGGVFRLHKS